MEIALDSSYSLLDLAAALCAALGAGALAGMRIGLGLLAAAIALFGVSALPASAPCARVCEPIEMPPLLGVLAAVVVIEILVDAVWPTSSSLIRWVRIAGGAAAAAAVLALAGIVLAEQGSTTAPTWPVFAVVGLIVGVPLALAGAFVALAMVDGAERAGGHRPTLSIFVSVAALAAAALTAWVPLAGLAVAATVALFALRLRARDKGRYKGLRILA